ncbi:MAG: hypothetical protein QS748_09995 [Candidatus Endonucleobacter bathymodioli]|uniref:Uncharacterized protein n=1 Tax=Candidatus Endonucleibacter bathymodioli TaxID=539814 RepID=A0AA90NWX6_9GAMM|nr:hypothetical protein [Candidatus Endonucleobacter bathymodioli]
MKVERYSSHLKGEGVNVVPQIRGNTSKATQNKNTGNEIPSFIAGAALGALLIAILSKK